ncbi:MAG TPA: hypothetical protein VGC70_13460 [Burkholderiales bacterium]
MAHIITTLRLNPRSLSGTQSPDPVGSDAFGGRYMPAEIAVELKQVAVSAQWVAFGRPR